jgi:rSAM/selenodomain-associated transferase 2
MRLLTMISVIIPVLDEEPTIGPCLRQFDAQAEPHELLVVDGGSRDATAAVVMRFPQVRLLHAAEKGRGRQMNQGAANARGDLLLFLHADTRLPPQGLRLIAAQLKQTDVAAGAFALRFDHPDPFLRLLARLSRINHLFSTYGDQGLFTARRTFEAVGGFAEIPLMEDVEIQKRLRPRGRFVKIPHPVVTSARRFLAKGIVRQQILNICLVLLFHAGVSPDRLIRFYRFPERDHHR